jgi:hypothetical protein
MRGALPVRAKLVKDSESREPGIAGHWFGERLIEEGMRSNAIDRGGHHRSWLGEDHVCWTGVLRKNSIRRLRSGRWTQLWHDRRIAEENPVWGQERIANELLLKLGLRVSPRTVAKYLPRPAPGRPRGDQRWSTFLRNHAQAIIACDFLVAVTCTFRVLCVLVVIEHHSRRLIHFKREGASDCGLDAPATARGGGYEARESVGAVAEVAASTRQLSLGSRQSNTRRLAPRVFAGACVRGNRRRTDARD